MKEALKKITKESELTHQYTDPKLMRRLKIFTIITIVIILVVFYKIFNQEINLGLALVGLLSGTSIGLLAGRMFKIHWDKETQRVISKIDRAGIIVLSLYISIEIGKRWIFGHWLEGAQLDSFALVFLDGLILGRLLIMLRNVRKVLIKENKIV